MATNTDTLPVESGKATRQTSRPPKARRGALTWAAILGAGIAVTALAVTTLRGGTGDTPAPRFYPQAEAIERQAHLEGQARTYGGDGNQATRQAAETAERQAHLDGQARTYGQDPADTPGTTAPEPELVPGSRHMPTR